MKVVRWKAVVPMLLTAAAVCVLWLLFIDRVIRRTIEFAGTEVVGAKVELAGARLRLWRADLLLTGLQVTDPNAPMTNLVEVPEIRAALNGRALLMKKVVVESLIVRGVRFGTPRATSGALKTLPKTAGAVTRRVLAWSSSIPIPTLDLQGLIGTVVRIPAVNADSLRTPRQARLVIAEGDYLRSAFDTEVRGIDPGPTVDSARALAERLRAADPRHMNPVQLATTANDVRTMIGRVRDLKARVDTARAHATRGVTTLRADVAGLDGARSADLAFVRGLVHIPSFEPPDVSMAMFGPMITERLKPYVYWVNVAEQYVPPGLDPRRRTGPTRLRRAGTSFEFPLAHAWPDFLLKTAAADLAIGGRTAAAGAYTARITGVTTEPAVYGRPLTFTAERQSSVGPRELRVAGMMDRTGSTPRDSLQALVPRITIPPFPIKSAGASLGLDTSVIEVALSRTGGELHGTWRLTADAAHWTRTGDTVAAGAPLRFGTREWAEDLLWRSIATIAHVELVAHLDGPVTGPHISVSSNVGDAVAGNVKRAMGAELQRAETQIRAKVDSLVAKDMVDARAKLTTLEGQVSERLAGPQQQLEQLQTELNETLGRVTSAVPGIRLPSIPGVTRPRP